MAKTEETFVKKEISRLASIAKKAVSSPSAGNINDKTSESELHEENPQVGETSSLKSKVRLKHFKGNFFQLCPPTPSTCITPFNICKPVTKGNHLCSSNGKSLKCKCDHHSGTGMEVEVNLSHLLKALQ